MASLRSVAIVLFLSWSACAPRVGSIGAVLSRDRESGAVHVRETPEGMAAEQAGLLVGDRIKMVDGVLIDELPAPEIRALLRGEVGSNVVLTVIRGERVLHVELKRERLQTGGSLPPRHESIE